MLLHYLGKFKNSNFLLMWKKTQTNYILIASDFVIHPQILIFSVFTIASLSPYWLQIKFPCHCSFTSLLLRSICGTENSSQETPLPNNQRGVQQRGQDFDLKSLYLKRYTANRLTDEFPEKSWTKRGVNKLLKKLRDTGTVDRRPVSGRPRSEKKIAMPSYA